MDPKNSDSSDEPEHDLSSAYTQSFHDLLAHLKCSILVSTYQAGYVIALRATEGELNTHFRSFSRPMGIAATQGRLAVGTSNTIIEFKNNPTLAHSIPSTPPLDACYLPRNTHFTGDIDIHEMAWGIKSELASSLSTAKPTEPELWFINTRFSCICTKDNEHSFSPKWRPRFIDSYSPQDRCHLNGMALVDGTPRYVTALGQSNKASGWRENKANGGILMDVPSGDVICQGLSMPHSPRWHDEKLWIAESGTGSIGVVDLQSGRYEPVTQLEGFTRGIDIIGPYAFVGISQVRESAIFSGIPLADRVKDRVCGVSVVDLRNGHEIGFVRFKGSVQEIFAVQALPHQVPDLLEPDDDAISSTFVLPDQALPEVKWV